jgi:hypothetical protein
MLGADGAGFNLRIVVGAILSRRAGARHCFRGTDAGSARGGGML